MTRTTSGATSATGAAVGGKRQRLGAAERREQLMAATVEVIAESGYQGATADAIARRAGTSKGLLWHYFTDRDDLLEQTARHTLDVLRRAVGATLDLSAPAAQVVRSAVHGAADLLDTHPAERRALNEIIFNLRLPDGSMRLGLEDLEQMWESQAQIFRRGQRDGSFRADLDATLLAVTYQGAVDSMLGYLEAHPGADKHRHASTVADVLLGGISLPGAISRS